jgi:hypothetical protein
MRVGDWISLAGLVVSVIGFGMTIRELVRITKASEADRPSQRVGRVHHSPSEQARRRAGSPRRPRIDPIGHTC